MALSQAFAATEDQKYLDRAVSLLDKILEWSDDLSVLGREKLPG
jgi:uncharacterized protein YyaL (SSP411 family)